MVFSDPPSFATNNMSHLRFRFATGVGFALVA